MFTKKIIIKNEEHFKEVVKALKSVGDEVYSDEFFSNLGMIAFNSDYKKWYRLCILKIFEDEFENVPEYEIVAKTSYQLKEVKKREIIKIGDNEYYKDELEIALKNIRPINEF